MKRNFTDHLAEMLANFISSFIHNNILFDGNTKLDFDKVLAELEKQDPELAKQIKDWKGTDKRPIYSSNDWSCGYTAHHYSYGCGSDSRPSYHYSGCGSSDNSSRSSC